MPFASLSPFATASSDISVASLAREPMSIPEIDEVLIERAPRDAMVMIIDDEQINLDVVQAYLEQEGFYNFVTTTDSREALDLAHTHRPDMVLLDIKMPHVDGLEILRGMRLDPVLKRVPTIVLTAEAGAEKRLKALRLGATDFLSKPVDPSELMLRLENVLAAKVYHDYLKEYSDQLERQVLERTEELERSRHEAIQCLARAGEYRDDVTGRHVMRVGRYSRIIAQRIGYSEEEAELLENAAQLHDLGKIGIPDSILNKKGKLTSEEYDVIKRHCTIGVNIISPSGELGTLSDTTSPVLRLASTIASSHHEKWDGSGYPSGLSGTSIPLEGRIVALADVFDALCSKRCYKEAFDLEKCFQIIREGRGQHFDPRIVDAFFDVLDDILDVAKELEDPQNASENV